MRLRMGDEGKMDTVFEESPVEPLSKRAATILALILTVFMVIGAQYAVLTPPWQVPDEPAHYNYVRQIVSNGRLPVLEEGDHDYGYNVEIVADGFPPDRSIEPLRYEDYQAPLYYILASPVYLMTGGDLRALRLFSLLLGAVAVFFIFLAVREVFPRSEVLPLTAAGFAAFIPQHLSIMSGFNNDALAVAVMCMGLWLVLRTLRVNGVKNLAALSLVVGAAFLSKLSVYSLAVIAALMLTLKARRLRWGVTRLVREGIILFVPAFLIGLPWWIRNAALYGQLDLLGLKAHNSMVVGQLTTSSALSSLGPAGFLQAFIRTTFQSFWGQFGWMGVLMSERTYCVLLFFSIFLAVGFLGFLISMGRKLTTRQRDSIVLLVISFLMAVSAYLYYNLSFVQHQGRYLYPGLTFISLGAASGLYWWQAMLLRLPGMARITMVKEEDGLSWLIFLPIILMAGLDIMALYGYIIPTLG
jgi:hypothetical protein